MRSNSKGKGQIFWQEKGVSPAFFRDRSTPFNVLRDGEAHNYAVKWSPENPVSAIRIDPSTGSGNMHLSNMQLTTGDRRVLHQW